MKITSPEEPTSFGITEALAIPHPREIVPIISNAFV
jgi:mannitol/fructose-specific phosphotransferase system IIA component (Ntr-type)